MAPEPEPQQQLEPVKELVQVHERLQKRGLEQEIWRQSVQAWPLF